MYRVQNDQQYLELNSATTPAELSLQVRQLNDDDMVFDLVGADAALANALRRVLLAEVPTIAIEKVFISENTSIIQDEVLAHRLGLIPIKADPHLFDEREEGDEATLSNTIVFYLDVMCPQAPAGDANTPPRLTVLSESLVWEPQSIQSEMFPGGFKPVHADIPIALLGPGQRISVEAHCVKGIGKDHSKFSPCSTASYRLLPDIQFKQPITGALAAELKAMCPMNVFDIEDIKGVSTARVARPRDCTLCRECIRKEGWNSGDRVQLGRKADHFIFSIESSGCVPAKSLFVDALKVLKKKAEKFDRLALEYEETSAAPRGSFQ